MTLDSAIRYRNLLSRRMRRRKTGHSLLSLRMRKPIVGNIWLRRNGSDVANFREIVHGGVYNSLVNSIQTCNYIIDLGANIGLATRLFAARYPSCKIVAVEPHLGNYSLLVKNVAGLLAAGRCRTLQAAVWHRKSRLAVAAPPQGETYYYGMFVKETDDTGEVPVDAITMPELIDQSGFPAVDILKIDIEGAEINLFQGQLDWLTKVKTIAIEFHGDSRERSGFDAIMRHYDFQVDDSDVHTVVAVRQEPTRRINHTPALTNS